MRRTRLASPCVALIACLAFAGLSNAAAAVQLTNWQGAQAAPTGYFSDVSWANGERIYAGFEVDPQSTQLIAKLFTITGSPGAMPPALTDLGLVSNTSIAVSIENDRSGGYFATATENLPFFESRSYIYPSASLGSPVAVIGPPPGNDPDVNLQAINKDGLAVGTIGLATPIVSDAAGSSFIIPHPQAAELLGVDSRGELFAGSSEPGPGEDPVATIFDATGTLLLQDSLPGRVWDVEGRFAVGTRDGLAAFWVENAQGVWQHRYLESPPGTPLEGELRSVDHQARSIAGGYVGGPGNERAVVVELRDESWIYLDDELGLSAGSLFSVAGIDVNRQTSTVAFAVEGADFSGWDVTAQLPPALPGPGLWVGVALACAGYPAGLLLHRNAGSRSDAQLRMRTRAPTAVGQLR